MPVLNEKQIKYRFDYYRKDEPHPKSIVEVSEYNGETALAINCTQLGDVFTTKYKTAKEKKHVLQELCSFYQVIQLHLQSYHWNKDVPRVI